jgi:hypothetical protein
LNCQGAANARILERKVFRFGDGTLEVGVSLAMPKNGIRGHLPKTMRNDRPGKPGNTPDAGVAVGAEPIYRGQRGEEQD